MVGPLFAAFRCWNDEMLMRMTLFPAVLGLWRGESERLADFVACVVSRGGLLGVVMVAAAAGIGSPASASTVSVESGWVRYVADPGERNEVKASILASNVTGDEEHVFEVVDRGAVIVAGQGCQTVDAHTVRCNAGQSTFDMITVDAGDMGDSVSLSLWLMNWNVGVDWDWIGLDSYVELQTRGGAGDDVLHGAGSVDSLDGGEGADRLWGHANDDRLQGGGGRDVLHGGDGNDILSDGDRDGAVGELAPGPDILDGGAGGGDTVDYGQRTNPVFVDLRKVTPNGQMGEGDRIKFVEGAVGGRGDDRLHGGRRLAAKPEDVGLSGGDGDDRLTASARGHTLDGGSGSDRLWGSARNDILWGGAGADRLSGKAGDDRLAGDAGADRLNCGPDGDEVWRPRRDLLRRSCDRIEFVDDVSGDIEWLNGWIDPYPSLGRWPVLTLQVGCLELQDDFDSHGYFSPQGVIRIRRRHGSLTPLARARITDKPPRCATSAESGVRVAAQLTPLGQRLARRLTGVFVTVSVKLRGIGVEDYKPSRMTWSIRLRAPAR